MFTYICIVASILILFYRYLQNSNRKKPKEAQEAPMEPGLPIIGILHKIEKPMHHYMMKLGIKHGPIFRMYFGMREFFVLNNYQILKMCLKDDGDNFSGRWRGYYFRLETKECGLLLEDGEVWARHRSFLVKVLRDFGLGSSRTTEIVQNECRELLKDITDRKDEYINFEELMPIHTANIISEFIMKKRFQRNDPALKSMIELSDNTLKKQSFLQFFHLMFPFWDNSYWCSKFSFSLSNKLKELDGIQQFFQGEIKAHSETLNLNSDGDDFIDRYLIEQTRTMERSGSVQTFTDFQLFRVCYELFVAGYETTSASLGWGILFLAKHQDIQETMHQEIVTLIGIEKMPSTIDKKSLPYTQAVMDEIMRLGTAAPMGIFHRTLNDTVVNGVFIPKDAFIIPNFYACHRDYSVWEKPFEFYPEHFLNRSENGELKYRPREELLSFGLGKRQCLGDSLAKAEFFIFLVSIVQQFRVSFTDNVTEEMYQDAVLGEDCSIRYSKIQNFKFDKYESNDE